MTSIRVHEAWNSIHVALINYPESHPEIGCPYWGFLWMAAQNPIYIRFDVKNTPLYNLVSHSESNYALFYR